MIAFEFLRVVLSQVAPLVVRTSDRLGGEGGLALVEKYLDEHIAVAFLLAVEHDLDVAGHGEDVVVAPMTIELVRIADADITRVEFQQAGKGHDAYLVAEAESSLYVCLGSIVLDNGIGSLNDVRQQIALAEGHEASRLWGRTVVEVPSVVAQAPLTVQFVGSEETEQIDIGIVALHVGCHLKQIVHDIVAVDTVLDPLLVIEEYLHQTLRMGDALLIGSSFLPSYTLAGFLQTVVV